ncbi:hypothetical protein HNV08_13100 [Winogradskyella eckloniae]|uniref:hypothetical protein n=1 Tax=Winogradskyella eckloniae TaxID=1089306 RepID=UPI00188591F4|nr:hypothetical protein [Winogradskyella eckloniae]NRD20987.1 hypothetical protein [Winogradskyella eckloniae]
MKKSLLFINCDEAKHICDKAEYGEATDWERFKLNIRLLYCHITKSYFKKNKTLTENIKKSNVKCLQSEERSKIEKQFNEALAEQNKN